MGMEVQLADEISTDKGEGWEADAGHPENDERALRVSRKSSEAVPAITAPEALKAK
jgi:hypothetical protein